MKVSVIVPALNEENYIEPTLRAIKAQVCPFKFELIVADGNSTDSTVAIAKKYCDKVVIETTRTIAAGRQAGARASSGKLIIYTDADSIPDKHWVERMAKAFDDPHVVAAFGMIEPLDASPFETALVSSTTRLFACFFNSVGLDYTYGNNLAVRRSAFDKIGGFNIYLITAEDTDVIHRIRTQGIVAFVPDALVRYSTRRIKKWGWGKYLMFHTKNFLNTFLFKTPAKHYEPVR